jgi:DNA polymerase
MSTPKQSLLATIHQFKRTVEEFQTAGEDMALFQTPLNPVVAEPAPSVPEASAKKIAVPKPRFELAGSEFEALAETVENCTACPLHRNRMHTVFGEGKIDAQVVFVGEAPGVDEEKESRPFMGEAGQLLDKILASIGLSRDHVYLCNLIKCRIPGNRNPQPGEIAACKLFLEKQLAVLKPKVICTLGAFAAQTLLETNEPLAQLRGHEHTYRGIPLIPTLHPESLIYHPQNKRLVWEDIKYLAVKLGLAGKST